MKYSQLPFLYIFIVSLLFPVKSMSEDGYKLWLRYAEITDPAHKYQVSIILSEISLLEDSPTAEVISDELHTAARGMLNSQPQISSTIQQSTGLIIALKETLTGYDGIELPGDISSLNSEGYYIGPVNFNDKSNLAIIGNDDNELLYGTFHLLRLLQMEDDLSGLPLTESPKIQHRLLNHWDNLDRTVERGYAGFSIWDWHKLPDYIDPRYIDYARANASIGLNGTVLTNVNANAWVLTSRYIEKVAALADAFRPYGLKVYLTARFSAPIELDNLTTADPLNEDVRAWWKEKVKEIYRQIPDFGGFLVKANSEGQPGPQDYGRSHADGANMLAEALDPYGGIVMWRAFVYSHEVPEDRAKQANMEFEPLDGQFHHNVFVQVKNGPI
ncbi:MAG: alpha-glucuronidase family glycosyl hydrolase, partial [Bacteroidales bacterium]